MTLGLLRPLCPICGVRTQLLMRNGRWRGACPECWANRPGYTHDQAPEGSERIYRNVAQIKVGRRWVNKSRHLAKLAGVALEPDMRARMRDGVLEVSVWQAVGGDPVKGSPAAGVHRPGPGRDRKPRPYRVEIQVDPRLHPIAAEMAAEAGVKLPRLLANLVEHAVLAELDEEKRMAYYMRVVQDYEREHPR